MGSEWSKVLLGRLSTTTTSSRPLEFVDENSKSENQAIWLQSQTWNLLEALYSYRLDPPQRGISAEELVKKNPFTPPRRIAEAISEESDIAEWMIIRDVLHSTSPLSTQTPIHPQHGYLPGTTRELKRALRMGGGKIDGNGLMKSLDVDSDVRESGVRGAGRLAGEDAAKITPTLHTLFNFVRQGKLNEALEFCKANNEEWRAASLVGGMQWSWPALMNDEGEDDAMVEDLTPTQGNLNRSLWRKMCRAIAGNNKLHPHERALYGSLAGDLASVLPVCKSWDDHLWAHLNAMIENRMNLRLKQVGGYWQSNQATTDDAEGIEETLEDVFDQIERTDRDGVSREAEEPYQEIQKHIILGRLDKAVSEFAGHLGDLDEQLGPAETTHLIRFFAHLVLYLPLLDISVDTDATNAILQAYITILEEEGNDALIAMYASEMQKGGAEDSYAQFLRAMNKHATMMERFTALQSGTDHNLDVSQVANGVIQPTLKIIQYKMSSERSLPFNKPQQTTISDQDMEIIRSLEWLVFDEATYGDAVTAANLYLRYYLGDNNLIASRAILSSLPSGLIDSMSSRDPSDRLENQVLEFQFHVILINALSALEKAEKEWQLNGFLINPAYDGIVELLTKSGWTTFRTIGDDDLRRLTFDRVKRLFAPEMLMRLHNLLMISGLTQNIDRAIHLPTIIANESYEIYPLFIRPDGSGDVKLAEYLEAVRKATMDVFRRGGNDGFVIRAK